MTSHKAIVSGLSGRYALAIFDLANENNALQAVEADFASLRTMLTESDDFGALVASPVITSEDQAKGVAAIADKAGFNALTGQFLGVLAANRRLTSLNSILSAFDRLVADQRGEVNASVTSAAKLTATQSKALQKNLKSALGQDVAIDEIVDESLLGGLKVKVGSRMIDSSLKTKLDNLAIAMKGVQ
ncbi:MAG: F0F1 ATP synthase subunit delta [Kordiimonadaceae bacterium]|nr:F0F1 ATP synthase subunit delta [Kordiimonadaceae bacterium]MBO6567613.1 F0F1 ATP synthase subunit delta [Kordiimonadaceae bacterium]MBO6963173.1 F0F1 ATP synthase subunit delta [Kordiimonadaceae bacterium]